MEVKLVRDDAHSVKADALILIETQGNPHAELQKTFTLYYESGELGGKFLDFTLLHGVPGFAAKRLLIAGAGKRDKFDAAALGKLAAAATRFLKGKGVRSVSLALDADLAHPEFIAAAARGFFTGAWEPDRLKTEKQDVQNPVEYATIVVDARGKDLDSALQRGVILGEASTVTRDIAVEPPNKLNPMALADRARSVAAASGLAIDVLDRDRMKQLGMGALLGVAQGSAEPPALIVLQYKPDRAAAGVHLGLIGKGVTFDTGGISIKPAEGMDNMKYDMCGGAAVIGAMQAIAKLKPAVAVTGLIPAVENMPGARAQRPGDIVTSLSGKTIEVLNTDAEGRLILADAITYAKQLGCTHLVDAATLTGAIVVGLGHARSGVFTNNEALVERWMKASESAGEPMWRMPLDDEYRELLKSTAADIQNIGPRHGGACTAAAFLKDFAGETPWVHLDVAGTAWLDEAKPWRAKGPSAVPLASFVHFVLDWE